MLPHRRVLRTPFSKEKTLIVTGVAFLLVWCAAQAVPAFGQDAILPQGDPRVQAPEEQSAEQEAIRDRRMKQQGQGPNYQIEGRPQPGTSGEHIPATGMSSVARTQVSAIPLSIPVKLPACRARPRHNHDGRRSHSSETSAKKKVRQGIRPGMKVNLVGSFKPQVQQVTGDERCRL